MLKAACTTEGAGRAFRLIDMEKAKKPEPKHLSSPALLFIHPSGRAFMQTLK
ncbi:hypothetical protein ADIAL_1196 [Alkalibacterium sp. AK22]|nr:hypothetical protein ADIAL_1196 [Alkalibacterium sp. AK22]